VSNKRTPCEEQVKRDTTGRNMKKRGIFIVLEGLDRSGKTTQIENFLMLCGDKTITLHFPNRYTEVGKLLDKYLKSEYNGTSEITHMLFSINRRECQDLIRETLNSGTNIICSRYSLSGIAYSLTNELDLNFCMNTEVGLINPDLTFFLDIDPKLALERNGYGIERYEKLDFQIKTMEHFNYLIDLCNTKEITDIVKLDGSESVEELSDTIIRYYKDTKDIVCGAPIKIFNL
jgi:dTMP kinase